MSGAPTAGSPRSSLWVIAAGATTMAVATLPAFFFGAFAVSIRADIGFSPAGIGMAASVFWGTSAASAPLVGRVVQALGAVRSVQLCGVGIAAALLPLALLAESWAALAVFLGFAGVANSIGQTAASLTLAEHGSEHNAGIAFGANQAAVPLASTVAGFAVPLFVVIGGWQAAFLLGATGAVLLAILAPRAILGSDRPARRESEVAERSSKGAQPIDRSVIGLITAGAFLAAGAALTLTSYFVAFAVESGYSEGGGGTLFALASLTSVVVRVIAGARLDRAQRLSGRRVNALAPAGAILLIGSAGFALLATAQVWSPALVVGTMLALGLGWSWAGLMTFAIVDLHRGAAAVATGVVLTGVFTGGVVMPTALGLVIDQVSYRTAWVAASACMGTAALLFLFASAILSRRARQTPEDPAAPT